MEWFFGSMQIELLDRRAWATRVELANAPQTKSRHDQNKKTVRKTRDRSESVDDDENEDGD